MDEEIQALKEELFDLTVQKKAIRDQIKSIKNELLEKMKAKDISTIKDEEGSISKSKRTYRKYPKDFKRRLKKLKRIQEKQGNVEFNQTEYLTVRLNS